jgi:nucleotide-binding universal stress UspA family protein
MADVIAVAVDGTPAGEGAVNLAGKFANKLGARVEVLCTLDAAYTLEINSGEVSNGNQIEYPAAAAEEIAAESIVAKALATLKGMSIEGAGTILSGTPARAIVDAALRKHVSLIVMGHRHLSWMDRLLHPSICWDVLEHAHCPVLVNVDDKT